MELIPLKSFDYETLPDQKILLTLIANDSVHTSTAQVTVHILDRNDVAPTFSGPYNVSVAENVTIGYNIVTVRVLFICQLQQLCLCVSSFDA